jgi:hypothetical protein
MREDWAEVMATCRSRQLGGHKHPKDRPVGQPGPTYMSLGNPSAAAYPGNPRDLGGLPIQTAPSQHSLPISPPMALGFRLTKGVERSFIPFKLTCHEAE